MIGRPTYVGRVGGCSRRLSAVYGTSPESDRQLDPEFFRRYGTPEGTGDLTPFAGIKRELWQPPSVSEDQLDANSLAACLSDVLTEELPYREAHVALSGGVDSWLLALLLRELGYEVQGWSLASDIPGYCERHVVSFLSDKTCIPCEYLEVNESRFVRLLPDLVAVAEYPVYNLHAVSKLVLAHALSLANIPTIVTGDGADQVMRCEWNCDLIPFTYKAFEAYGPRLVTPFLSGGVVARCRVPDQDKETIRALARRLGLPPIPKRPAIFPQVELPPTPRAPIHAFGVNNDCLAYTTGILLELLESRVQCAALRG